MKFAAAPDLGLRALHARYVTHEYERHAHDFYVIGSFESGAVTIALGQKRVVAPAETVLIINPGQSHDGKPADEKGYQYGMLYIDPHVVTDLAEELEAPAEFAAPLLTDPMAVRHVRGLHRAIFHGEPALRQEFLLLDTLRYLIAAYSGAIPQPQRDPRIRRVRDFIHAHYSRTFTTGDLAGASGLGRSQLNQLFRAAYGLPLHAYLNGVRLEAARALLLTGLSGAETAAAVGLSDQSHLIRRFRGSYGITPTQFVAAHRTDVQSCGGKSG